FAALGARRRRTRAATVYASARDLPGCAMRASPASAAVLALAGFALPGAAIAKADPLVHTYSIVARDPATGEMGVAVQSHWFSVGSIVTWAEAGVGVVATQSLVDPAYGPKGLALMRQGV